MTHNVYDIKIEHQHQIIEPAFEIENTDSVSGIYEQYYSTYQNDIISELYEGSGTYHFSKDDYISVTVQNKNKTLATKLQQAFLQHEIPNVQIFVTYGGNIRDEVK